MKRIITIVTLLVLLVCSVFAEPKKVYSQDVNGYEAIIWDIGVSQKYTTFDEPVQLFLAEILLEGSIPVGTVKSDFKEMNKDLQKLIEEYDYYLCYLDGELIAVVYRNDAETIWTIIY